MIECQPDCQFLSGKVRKSGLPLFTCAPPPGAPALKRLQLPQGELAQFHDGEPAIRYIAYIQLQRDTVRGNHFHKHKEELIYILAGEIELAVEDPESKNREFMRVQTGELVTIAPGVAHALRVIVPGQAVEFSTAMFDIADTVRYAVAS